jgi:hypothetical protein
MSGAFAAELPEPLDIVDRNRELAITTILGVSLIDATEMEHRVQQHRGMAIGQHEAITIGPIRIVGIEAEKPLPQRVDQWCQRHWGAGVSGIGLLHGINRKRANGDDAKLIERAALPDSHAREFGGSDRCQWLGRHWEGSHDPC